MMVSAREFNDGQAANTRDSAVEGEDFGANNG